jgi:hypothetical protein
MPESTSGLAGMPYVAMSVAFDERMLIFSEKHTLFGMNAYLAVQRVLGSLCLLNLQPPERGLGLLGLVRPLNILPGNDRRYSGASIHNPTRPTVASREHRKDSKVLRSASLCCAPLMHWHADQSGRTFLQIKRPCLTYLSLVARNQRPLPQ